MKHIEWNGLELMQLVVKASDHASKEGAKIIEKDAKSNLRAHIAETKNSQSTGTLEAHIGIKKSEFKDGGYIVGVFGESTGSWESSIGARSIFIEFGHAAPYRGRRYVGQKNVKKHAAARPFLRPALRKNKHKIVKLFNQKLTEMIHE